MYKTLARPAKKSKPQPLEEINLIKLHVVEEPEDKIFNCVDAFANLFFYIVVIYNNKMRFLIF